LKECITETAAMMHHTSTISKTSYLYKPLLERFLETKKCCREIIKAESMEKYMHNVLSTSNIASWTHSSPIPNQYPFDFSRIVVEEYTISILNEEFPNESRWDSFSLCPYNDRRMRREGVNTTLDRVHWCEAYDCLSRTCCFSLGGKSSSKIIHFLCEKRIKNEWF
jgi:hypothetical protein